ncbi:unnamed protein product [Staurois parvus]|uniref:Uncharacterized protein n=1 Tax=Staurois parvus TaxID=386267 RepID=A0ABN9DTV2_9NEOB|nr:unnamed protein product [Staurois parvus]
MRGPGRPDIVNAGSWKSFKCNAHLMNRVHILVFPSVTLILIMSTKTLFYVSTFIEKETGTKICLM